MMSLFSRLSSRLPFSLVAMGVVVSLSSCVDYTDRQALTQLRFDGVQSAKGGAFNTADAVVSRVDLSIQDEVSLLLTNEAVSANVPADSNYDVILDGYTVSFERTDGGTNVPSSWGTTFTQRITSSEWGSFNEQIVKITLFPLEQKFVRPLSDLTYFGFEQGTNFTQIQAMATVKFFGKNRMGDVADVTCKFRVVFCANCQPVQ